MSQDSHKDNISRLDEPKSVQAQASAWLAKLDSDDPSAQDLQGFKRWVNEDTAHIAAFEKVAAAWDELNILTRLPLLLEQQAVQARNKTKTRGVSVFRYMALAASLVLVVLLGLQQAFKPVQRAIYTTGVGEQRSYTLPDKSVVQLNTNSRLEFDYRDEVRAVYLHQGEAHFSVAKNPERPFEVYARAGLVRAVGTAFAVMLSDQGSDVNVIVTEGVVEIAPEIVPKTLAAEIAPEQTLISEPVRHRRVEAGNAAVFDQREVRVVEKIAANKMQQRLAWQQGQLIFSGESLEEVVAEISRYTDTNIVIKSEAAKALRIGGQFDVADTRSIFSALEKGFGLDVEYATNKLVYITYPEKKVK